MLPAQHCWSRDSNLRPQGVSYFSLQLICGNHILLSILCLPDILNPHAYLLVLLKTVELFTYHFTKARSLLSVLLNDFLNSHYLPSSTSTVLFLG